MAPLTFPCTFCHRTFGNLCVVSVIPPLTALQTSSCCSFGNLRAGRAIRPLCVWLFLRKFFIIFDRLFRRFSFVPHLYILSVFEIIPCPLFLYRIFETIPYSLFVHRKSDFNVCGGICVDTYKKAIPAKGPLLIFFVTQSALKGRRDAMRARLIATASSRWCFAQVPVIRRGRILPPSLMNFLSLFVSL